MTNKLKTLSHLPKMPGITKGTRRFLKIKSFLYIAKHDKTGVIRRYILKHPLRHGWRLLCSLVKRKSFVRSGDLFFYGVRSLEEFEKKIQDPNSLLVTGFSYCHKPFECPKGRFTDQCIHDPNHPVCSQCFIGKAVNAMPEKGVIPLFIPTIHYIGEKIFEIIEANPTKKILFIITACELTLEMFGDFGNMAGIQGIGIRLDGRICNTMKAFDLSERGIKPGLTVVLEPTQQIILNLMKQRSQTDLSTS